MSFMIDSYSIQEVSKMASVSKHTLRFWEKSLTGVIIPLRTKGGQRRYTKKHLQVINEIKRMKQKGLSLNDIKAKMCKSLNLPGRDEKSMKIDILANQIAEVVKASIYDFLLDDKET
jgi:DNA-binding transcriptional MerR regulator